MGGKKMKDLIKKFRSSSVETSRPSPHGAELRAAIFLHAFKCCSGAKGVLGAQSVPADTKEAAFPASWGTVWQQL